MYAIEVTDTFGGEPNYCWVRRGKHYPKMGASATAERRALIKTIREVAQWPVSVRVNVRDYGDMVEVRPVGLLQVAFAQWEDEGEHERNEIY